MKYKLYRSFGDLNKQIKQHTLVAVEYGKDIFDVTPALIRAVNDELSNSPEYENATHGQTLRRTFPRSLRSNGTIT